MFKTSLVAGVIALAGLAMPATAMPISGIFTINIHNFSDGGSDGNVESGNSAATAANVAAVGLDATVTWTGTLNFGIGGGNSGSTFISDFFASNAGGGFLTDVSAAEQAFLDNTLLSQGSYQTTTFFDIMGIFAGDVTNGLITHDDGVTLIASNQTGGVDSPPTTEEETAFTADAGAFRLIYASANGNPSILRVTGDVAPAPVPLPAGVVLLLSGLGGLALAKRRSKRAA